MNTRRMLALWLLMVQTCTPLSGQSKRSSTSPFCYTHGTQAPADLLNRQLEMFYQTHHLNYRLMTMQIILIGYKGAFERDPEMPDRGGETRSLQDAIKRAQFIRIKAISGVSMTILAKAYSEDSDSMEAGGQVAPRYDYQVKNSIFSPLLTMRVGEISHPIVGHSGVYLARLLSSRVAPLSEVKEQVGKDMCRDK